MTEWLNVEPVTEARIGRGAPYPWVRIPQSGHAKTPMKPIAPVLGEVKGTAFFDGAIAKEIYNRKYEVCYEGFFG